MAINIILHYRYMLNDYRYKEKSVSLLKIYGN